MSWETPLRSWIHRNTLRKCAWEGGQFISWKELCFRRCASKQICPGWSTAHWSQARHYVSNSFAKSTYHVQVEWTCATAVARSTHSNRGGPFHPSKDTVNLEMPRQSQLTTNSRFHVRKYSRTRHLVSITPMNVNDFRILSLTAQLSSIVQRTRKSRW